MWELYDELIDGIPEGIPVQDIVIGKQRTAVLTEQGCGVCAAYPGEYYIDSRPFQRSSRGFRDLTIKDLARSVKSYCMTEAAVGAAAINAYYNSPKVLETSGLMQEQGEMGNRLSDPFISYQNEIKGKNVTVVGHYHFLEQLYKPVCNLSIISEVPIWGDYPPQAADYLLPDADYVILGGAALASKTLPGYLALSQNAKVIIVDPSTVMSPVLFRYGVWDLSGFCSQDFEKTMQSVKNGQGVSFYDTGRKVSLKRSTCL